MSRVVATRALAGRMGRFAGLRLSHVLVMSAAIHHRSRVKGRMSMRLRRTDSTMYNLTTELDLPGRTEWLRPRRL